MDWTAQLFGYCERGQDPSFWAEPFNAISNAAFLIAAAFALSAYVRGSAKGGAELSLIAIVAIIGIGSFLFHTYATRWAVLADVAPIGVFMFAYLIYALRRFLLALWWIVAAMTAAFFLLFRATALVPCATGLLPITEAAGRPCLNGSLSYAPALVALPVLAAVLFWRGHAAAKRVAIAAAVLAVSLTLRTLDIEVCAITDLLGRARGTHALWHILNAAVLYQLLMAAILHGTSDAGTIKARFEDCNAARQAS